MIFFSDILLEKGLHYYVCDVDQLCHERARAKQLDRFERSLTKNPLDPLTEIDSMTGYEFEDLFRDLLPKLGYHVERTKRSHDHGLDLLLERYGETNRLLSETLQSTRGKQSNPTGKRCPHVSPLPQSTRHHKLQLHPPCTATCETM